MIGWCVALLHSAHESAGAAARRGYSHFYKMSLDRLLVNLQYDSATNAATVSFTIPVELLLEWPIPLQIPSNTLFPPKT